MPDGSSVWTLKSPREVREGGAEGKAVSKVSDSSRARVRDQKVNVGDSNKEGCCAYPTVNPYLHN